MRRLTNPTPRKAALVKRGKAIKEPVHYNGREITLPNKNKVAVSLLPSGEYELRFVARDARKEVVTTVRLTQMATKALSQLLLQGVWT